MASQLYVAVRKALAGAGIEIPIFQRNFHLRSVDGSGAMQSSVAVRLFGDSLPWDDRGEGENGFRDSLEQADRPRDPRNSNMDQNSVTKILQENPGEIASEKLLPIVYQELRRMAAAQMAREAPGQTLQPTALVHEAYVRLVGDEDIRWQNRAHFFAAAARSMRQILINRANRRKAVKHGGGRKRVELDGALLADDTESERLLALDEALNRLEQIDPRKAKIVMLRFFAGLSIDETASAVEISPATVKREWQFARTWLHKEMNKSAP